MLDASSGGAPQQAPRWDLVDTESYGGGIRVLAPSLIVWSLDVVSKSPGVLFIEKITFRGFIPFGLRLIFLFFETLKQAKNNNSGLGLRLIG